MDTTLTAPREFVPRRPNKRIAVLRPSTSPLSEDLDDLIERLRGDVFALYTTIRETQRERALPSELRLRMLGEAAHDARQIADAIHRRQAASTFDLEPTAFAVPV